MGISNTEVKDMVDIDLENPPLDFMNLIMTLSEKLYGLTHGHTDKTEEKQKKSKEPIRTDRNKEIKKLKKSKSKSRGQK